MWLHEEINTTEHGQVNRKNPQSFLIEHEKFSITLCQINIHLYMKQKAARRNKAAGEEQDSSHPNTTEIAGEEEGEKHQYS